MYCFTCPIQRENLQFIQNSYKRNENCLEIGKKKYLQPMLNSASLGWPKIGCTFADIFSQCQTNICRQTRNESSMDMDYRNMVLGRDTLV